MDKENSLKVLCDFQDGVIGIENILTFKGENEEYGDFLSLVFLIIRILSITRKNSIKNEFISALKVGSGYAWSSYPESLRGYADSLVNVDLEFEADGKSKQGFVLEMSFNKNGHTNKLRPRGFGILGRNIDFASYYFIIGYYDYLLEKYPNREVQDKLNSIVNRTLDFMEFAGGKINTKDEYTAVENLTKEYVSFS